MVLTAAVIAAALVSTGGQAVGDGTASSSSTTQFEASATLVTPPSQVGYRIYVKIAGRIVATGHSKVVNRCRADRTVNITWTRLDGFVPRGNATYPSSRKGRFGAEASFAYDYDVPLAGGAFRITISTKSVSVAGKRYRSFRCKKLRETLLVDIPPAAF